jgi:hypothetical protein
MSGLDNIPLGWLRDPHLHDSARHTDAQAVRKAVPSKPFHIDQPLQ